MLVRDLIERSYDEGVSTVYVEDLTDILVRANAKTHFRAFIHQLTTTAEEYGIKRLIDGEATAGIQHIPNYIPV